MIIITRSHARHLVDETEQMFLKMGYVAREPADGRGHAHYCGKWCDKPGGRTAWPQHEVDMRRSGNKIEMRGPVFLVEWLRYRLLKERME